MGIAYEDRHVRAALPALVRASDVDSTGAVVVCEQVIRMLERATRTERSVAQRLACEGSSVVLNVDGNLATYVVTFSSVSLALVPCSPDHRLVLSFPQGSLPHIAVLQGTHASLGLPHLG